jgi:hypothetical protein
MIGISFKLPEIAVWAAHGPGAPAPAGVFTMTQVPAINSQRQRSTVTGGGQGKGQGYVPVAMSAVMTAGKVYARCSSGGGTRGDLQAAWLATTLGTTGAQTVNIPGVDARLGNFFLDLSGDGVTWQNGTTPLVMGRGIGFSGQSLMVTILVPHSDTTLASALGVFPPTNGLIVQYNGSVALTAFTDTGSYTSAGGMELLNRQIAEWGVSCFLVGYAVGGSAISSWVPGGANLPGLLAALDATGGPEDFLWMQGHSDTNTAPATYLANLVTLWQQIAAHSPAFPAFGRYLCAIPNNANDTWGPAINKEGMNIYLARWCAANGVKHVPFHDLATDDGTHQTQAGCVRSSQHWHRAMMPGGAGDAGPTITSISRSGVNITLNVTLAAGSTNLVTAGSPATRFKVYVRGDRTAPLALDATTPITFGSPSAGVVPVTLKLAADPGTVPIEVLPWGYNSPSNDGSADGIWDNHTDGDGITIGRELGNSVFPVETRVNNPLTGTSPVFAATGGPFGAGAMTGGTAVTAFSPMAAFPVSTTVELWVRCNAVVTGNKTFIAQTQTGGGAWGLYVNNGNLVFNSIGVDNTGPALTVGAWTHVAIVFGSHSEPARVYVNGVLAITIGIGLYGPGTQPLNLRTRSGSNSLTTTGDISDLTIWEGQRYSANFTPPAAPYTGSEGMLHYYHLADTTDSAA